MSYTETLETRGEYRARLIADDDPQAPDADGTAHIIEVDPRGDWWNCTVRRADYSRHAEAADLAGELQSAIQYARDHGHDEWTFAERYLRAFHHVVSFDRTDWARGALVAIVTADLADAWGCPPDKRADAATEGLAEWRAYRDGDVYLYAIERRTTWARVDDYAASTDDARAIADADIPATRDTWETVDSCGGYYGAEYATEAALEALDAYAPPACIADHDTVARWCDVCPECGSDLTRER